MGLDTGHLAETLGLDVSQIDAAIQSEEVVKLDFNGARIIKADETIYSEDDFNTLKANHETAVNENQAYSQQVGQEILLKDLKNQFGMDFEGRKDPDKFKAAFKSLIDTKVAEGISGDPDERYQKIQAQLLAKDTDIENIRKEALTYKEQNEVIQKEKDELELTYQKRADSELVNKEIINAYEKKKELLAYNGSDLLKLYLMDSNTAVINGIPTALDVNGDPVKDKLANNKPLEDDFADWCEKTGKYKKVSGGNGGNDGTGTGKRTVEEFTKLMERENISEGSSEYNKRLIQGMSDGTVSDD